MCGIFGYIGPREVLPRLLDGLHRLEYRGYDSAGVALLGKDGLWIERCVGRVADLEKKVRNAPPAVVGIAHTRWATHGGITLPNAHPHLDGDNRIAVIHNGIIENFVTLRNQLQAEGVVFLSETDTEVLPHLIAHYYRGDPIEAVASALREVRGSYGIAVLFADHPECIVAARNGSPLVVGLGDDETVIASDPQPVVAHTRRVVYLQDREIALVTRRDVDVRRLDGTAVNTEVEVISGDYDVADRRGFEHFMLKEIHEQPESLERCLRGRVDVEAGNARLGGLDMTPRELISVSNVVNIGCGTSWHAGLVGAMAIEGLARVPARAEIASEYRYRRPIVGPETLFFAISQSGETADTLGAVQEIKLKGGNIKGVVNVVGSTIARECGAGTYVYAGSEVAVASTKAFTSQVASLLLFALMLGRNRDLSLTEGRAMARDLLTMPARVAEYLQRPGPIEAIAKELVKARYVLFLGRGFSYPVALEGALKLKEVAYVPCEAYPAGEMKHGPIAMLDEGTPVVMVIPHDEQRDKALSNLREVQARGARVIVIHTVGDDEVASLGEFAVAVPAVPPWTTPIVTSIPLQLLAYHAGRALGRDIDKPRNLAKSVTVE